MSLTVGVLALQGAFVEHVAALRELGAVATHVRLPHDLDGLDGLVIPGGESTVIGQLAATFGLLEPLRATIASGLPVWGTCAGAIVLARDVMDGRVGQPTLGTMDITITRNAFGRQQDSFMAPIAIPALGPEPFPAIFIRAPLIADVRPTVRVLATLDDGTIVAAQEKTMLATVFHPELSADRRLHTYFLDMCRGTAARSAQEYVTYSRA